MISSALPPRTPPFPLRELGASPERHWTLSGPNSGGGEYLVLCRGEVLRVAYGDLAPSAPDGAETVEARWPVQRFIAEHARAPGGWGVAARELAAETRA